MYSEKIAKILRIDKKIIEDLEKSLEKITGKTGILKKIVEENEDLISNRLDQLGLGRHVRANEVYDALISKIEADDYKFSQAVNISSLKSPETAATLIQFIQRLQPSPFGFFLKKEKAAELLKIEPPKNILKILHYKYVEQMLEKEDLLEIYSALRFIEDSEWLNEVFFKQFKYLSFDDFEKRPIEFKILSSSWVKIAEKFIQKKYHNVSHLKELGAIFIIPRFLGVLGEVLRLTSLLLHYRYEVSYYSDIFQNLVKEKDPEFTNKLTSLLRGDIVEERLPLISAGKYHPRFLVLPRYLAKDNESDWRLFEPHISPEALHWQRAEKDIGNISKILPNFNDGLVFWKDLGWVGDYFLNNNKEHKEILVSFNIVDTVMSLVKRREFTKYLYHHQEALWNKIFIEYFSVEELEKMSKDYILRGWFQLS